MNLEYKLLKENSKYLTIGKIISVEIIQRVDFSFVPCLEENLESVSAGENSGGRHNKSKKNKKMQAKQVEAKQVEAKERQYSKTLIRIDLDLLGSNFPEINGLDINRLNFLRTDLEFKIKGTKFSGWVEEINKNSIWILPLETKYLLKY